MQSNFNQKESWFLSEISNLEHKKKFLYSCFEDKQSITLQGIKYWSFQNEQLQSVNEQYGGIISYFTTDQIGNTIGNNTDMTVTNNLIFEIEIICECIKLHEALDEFTLSNCKITDKEVQIITEAVKIHMTLRKLDISCNKISDEGVSFIGDCLKVNQTLHKINLSDNQITDKGMEALTEAVTVNKALQSVDVSGNVISDDGVSS